MICQRCGRKFESATIEPCPTCNSVILTLTERVEEMTHEQYLSDYARVKADIQSMSDDELTAYRDERVRMIQALRLEVQAADDLLHERSSAERASRRIADMKYRVPDVSTEEIERARKLTGLKSEWKIRELFKLIEDI